MLLGDKERPKVQKCYLGRDRDDMGSAVTMFEDSRAGELIVEFSGLSLFERRFAPSDMMVKNVGLSERREIEW